MSAKQPRENPERPGRPPEKAEDDLKLYRAIISSASEAIAVIDQTHTYLMVNKSFEDFWGLTRDRIVGKRVPDIVGPHKFADTVREKSERCMAGEAISYHTWYESPRLGPRYIHLNYYPYRNDTGEIIGRISIGHDITDRKKAEDDLRQNESLLRLITGHTSALVSIHDAAGRYIFASPSHRQLGYDPSELIGQSGFTIMETEDVQPLTVYLEKARKEKTSHAFLNYRLRNRNGDLHHYRGSFDAVFTPDGELETIICVGEDITELRKAQTEKMEAVTLAAEAQKFALVGQIAGKMAHDFNNILGAIMGNAELALLDSPHEPTRKTLELILDQTLRGRNLTRNLVAFAKDQEPKQEFFSMEKKMDLVVNLLKKDLEGIEVVQDFRPGLPELLADPGMIEHAVVNLIQNAIHALSLTPRPRIVIRLDRDRDRLIIEIEDNGCGIPEEYMGSIFEPSFTLKGSRDRTGLYKPGIKGTGYGMSNVKRYIEKHRGRVFVHSELGKGTRVTLWLPVIEKRPTNLETPDIRKETFCSGKRILLVEDEPAISEVQFQILTQAPYSHRVDRAETCRAAMDLLNGQDYDLVSLDYILSGKHTGMDIYQHIRKKSRTLPVLFISGNIEFLESIKDLSRKDPHIDHLSKPCRHVDYVNRINQLLLRRSPCSATT